MSETQFEIGARVILADSVEVLEHMGVIYRMAGQSLNLRDKIACDVVFAHIAELQRRVTEAEGERDELRWQLGIDEEENSDER